MYLSDIASESYYSHNRGARNGGGNGNGSTRDVDSLAGGPARRSSHVYRTSPPAPPTSIPIDDNFDAYTTEVPTEWVVGDHEHDREHDQDCAEYDRDESVSGYRNYVQEMERMLSGQMESAARAQERRHQQYRDRERDLGQQQQMQETRAQASRVRAYRHKWLPERPSVPVMHRHHPPWEGSAGACSQDSARCRPNP